ncbi:MAG: hypothetical protein OEX07_04525 [Gammaproteobacteria bacterium]|nr:hypothetical protein [Gammaproteobacteria bacterium]
MSDNLYRTILGAILLVALYADIEIAIYVLAGIVLLEGITNWRIPKIINKIRSIDNNGNDSAINGRFNIEAERMFRFTVGGFMLATYPLGPESVVWFFPWFMGFAILGAGVSGICPALALFKWLGFR